MAGKGILTLIDIGTSNHNLAILSMSLPVTLNLNLSFYI